MTKGICLALLSVLFAGTAHASTYTGLIAADGVRLSPSPVTPARVGVSVPQNQPTNCPSKGFYTYENAATGLGGLWTTALIQARIHNRIVQIVGTGTCDSFGFELISHIDLR